MNNFLN